jgi:hypothetical protein
MLQLINNKFLECVTNLNLFSKYCVCVDSWRNSMIFLPIFFKIFYHIYINV